ncbi:MAG: ribonuclease P protein component [Burkholderiales bacterium]|nr:MAG: ribonuclease P protein component [Burkholderiales bacterium]
MAKIRRITRSKDFEDALATRSRASAQHFSVHHLARAAGRPAGLSAYLGSRHLSTGEVSARSMPVDGATRTGSGRLVCAASQAAVQGFWLGMVVPKRCAGRSVTRNLIRREIRAGFERSAPILPPGIWVVRLRAPFEGLPCPSAASVALRHAVRAEVDSVLRRAARFDR